MGRKETRRAQAARSAAATSTRAETESAPSDPNAWTTRDRRYWPAVAALVVAAAALRLYDLAGPIFQHDEAIYALFQGTRDFATYKFDPVYHGPTLYHLLQA